MFIIYAQVLKKNGRNNKTFIQKSDGNSYKTIQTFKWNERDDKTIHSQKILNELTGEMTKQ